MATTSYGYSPATWGISTDWNTTSNDSYVRYTWSQQYSDPIFSSVDIEKCIDNDGWDPE